jgi:hypothetical protein
MSFILGCFSNNIITLLIFFFLLGEIDEDFVINLEFFLPTDFLVGLGVFSFYWLGGRVYLDHFVMSNYSENRWISLASLNYDNGEYVLGRRVCLYSHFQNCYYYCWNYSVSIPLIAYIFNIYNQSLSLAIGFCSLLNNWGSAFFSID